MSIYTGNTELKEVFHGNERIKMIYKGADLIWQYDSVPPSLVINAPTSTSSSSPTYTTSGTTYRVSGTVLDADSGVAGVYVNNSLATLSGYNWYKDVTLTADVTATISIYAVDNAGNRTSTVTRYVRYDSAAPKLTVSAPTGTSSSSPTYVQNEGTATYTVSGAVSDADGIKSLTVNNAAVTITSNGTWSKALSLATNTTHTITVKATDNAGRTSTVIRYVRVDGDKPALTVSIPSGAATWTSASSYTVSGTASDKSGIKSLTVNGSAATVNSNGSWSKAVSVNASGTTTVTIVVTDKAGRSVTAVRYLQKTYKVFNVLKETQGQESGDTVTWHSGMFSVADSTITCNVDSQNIRCNRTGKLYVYLYGRNSTGASLQGNLSLFKNNSRVGGITIPSNQNKDYSVTINVNNGDNLSIRNDGGNAYIYVRAGSYFEWVG